MKNDTMADLSALHRQVRSLAKGEKPRKERTSAVAVAAFSTLHKRWKAEGRDLRRFAPRPGPLNWM